MCLCWTLSCAVVSSGKNLWRRASAVSSTDVVTDPSERISDVSTDPLEAQFRNHSSERNLKQLHNSLQNSSMSNFLKIRTVVIAYLEMYGWTKRFL